MRRNPPKKSSKTAWKNPKKMSLTQDKRSYTGTVLEVLQGAKGAASLKN